MCSYCVNVLGPVFHKGRHFHTYFHTSFNLPTQGRSASQGHSTVVNNTFRNTLSDVKRTTMTGLDQLYLSLLNCVNGFTCLKMTHQWAPHHQLHNSGRALVWWSLLVMCQAGTCKFCCNCISCPPPRLVTERRCCSGNHWCNVHQITPPTRAYFY